MWEIMWGMTWGMIFAPPPLFTGLSPTWCEGWRDFSKNTFHKYVYFSQGRERFIPNVGTFHSLGGNKRYVILYHWRLVYRNTWMEWEDTTIWERRQWRHPIFLRILLDHQFLLRPGLLCALHRCRTCRNACRHLGSTTKSLRSSSLIPCLVQQSGL